MTGYYALGVYKEGTYAEFGDKPINEKK